MDPERYLFDTSALLTLTEDEEGADRVEQILKDAHALIPWMALLEAYYISQQERGMAEADHRYALMKALPATILWDVDESMLLSAARLKADHRLSLADTIIASLAIQQSAVLLHKDPEYEALSGKVRLEALPYKRP